VGQYEHVPKVNFCQSAHTRGDGAFLSPKTDDFTCNSFHFLTDNTIFLKTRNKQTETALQNQKRTLQRDVFKTVWLRNSNDHGENTIYNIVTQFS